MAIELTKEEIADVIPSLRRYFKEELELEISEMRSYLTIKLVVFV